MKKDTTLKIVVVAALTIIALWFIKATLFPTGYGMSVSYRIPMHMNNSYNYNNGFNSFGGSGILLLTLLIKIFLIVFVITLFAGLAMFVKNHVFTQEDISTMKNGFIGNFEKDNIVCSECGRNLSEEWKICPNCGKEVDKP